MKRIALFQTCGCQPLFGNHSAQNILYIWKLERSRHTALSSVGQAIGEARGTAHCCVCNLGASVSPNFYIAHRYVCQEGTEHSITNRKSQMRREVGGHDRCRERA